MKRTLLLAIDILFYTHVLAQGTVDSNALTIGKHAVASDTIEVKIIEIVFITNDTTLNGFMIFDTLGTFNVFGSQQRLNDYITSQKGGIYLYKDDRILGTGNYLRVFNKTANIDTIYSYRNAKIEYYDGKKLRTDNLGIPILEYDIEHSYILEQMNQNTSGQYIYCLINEGTKRFVGIHPTNYLKGSLLLKVDTTQDTTYNFFKYRVQAKSYQGMQLVEQDSIIMPLKELRRKKWVFSNMDELLTSKGSSDIYSNNHERTYMLIVKEERYVVSATTQFSNKVDRWVALVESIAITLNQLQEKLFQQPARN